MCGDLCANVMKCRLGHEHRMTHNAEKHVGEDTWSSSQESEGVFHTTASVDGGGSLKNTEVEIGVRYIRQRNSAV